MGQWLSLPMVIVGIALLVHFNKAGKAKPRA
jgi:prolipoprotein diacylglyceryltransferase